MADRYPKLNDQPDVIKEEPGGSKNEDMETKGKTGTTFDQEHEFTCNMESLENLTMNGMGGLIGKNSLLNDEPDVLNAKLENCKDQVIRPNGKLVESSEQNDIFTIDRDTFENVKYGKSEMAYQKFLLNVHPSVTKAQYEGHKEDADTSEHQNKFTLNMERWEILNKNQKIGLTDQKRLLNDQHDLLKANPKESLENLTLNGMGGLIGQTPLLNDQPDVLNAKPQDCKDPAIGLNGTVVESLEQNDIFKVDMEGVKSSTMNLMRGLTGEKPLLNDQPDVLEAKAEDCKDQVISHYGKLVESSEQNDIFTINRESVKNFTENWMRGLTVQKPLLNDQPDVLEAKAKDCKDQVIRPNGKLVESSEQNDIFTTIRPGHTKVWCEDIMIRGTRPFDDCQNINIRIGGTRPLNE